MCSSAPASTAREARSAGEIEYFSEDPVVSGELAAAYIKGVQSLGVGTSMKHFALNNQEYRRLTTDAVVDERAMFELYLSSFERVLRQVQPWTVMCSYNRVKGVNASDNKWLLTDVLREKFGFDGLVMSDWGAVFDRVTGVSAGLDLEMLLLGPITTGRSSAQSPRAHSAKRR